MSGANVDFLRNLAKSVTVEFGRGSYAEECEQKIVLTFNQQIVHANGLFCLQSARLSSLISNGNHETSPRKSERADVCKSVRRGVA